MSYQKRIEAVHRSSNDIYDRNQERGPYDEGLPGQKITQPAGQRSRQHVGEEKPKSQGSNGRVGGVKLSLNSLLHAGQDVAVYVVDKVETCEHHERRHCAWRRTPAHALPRHLAETATGKAVSGRVKGVSKMTTCFFITGNTEATLPSMVDVSRFNSAKNILAR